jgi:hypothetical protein
MITTAYSGEFGLTTCSTEEEFQTALTLLMDDEIFSVERGPVSLILHKRVETLPQTIVELVPDFPCGTFAELHRRSLAFWRLAVATGWIQKYEPIWQRRRVRRLLLKRFGKTCPRALSRDEFMAAWITISRTPTEASKVN